MSMPTDEALQSRHDASIQFVDRAAQFALSLFQDRDKLDIEVKGLQDWVSNADKSVEDQLREALQASFPDDGIIGEEHGDVDSKSGYTWVIDPIDGTTNFVTGTPGWCVVLACVYGGETVSAAICDPVAAESYSAIRGGGAFLNGKQIHCSTVSELNQGTLGVGHSTRVSAQKTLDLMTSLLNADGLFRRGGSGALDLVYVAAGRLIGFVEPHMNAWDCIAALLLIEEAGGKVDDFDMTIMLKSGSYVVATCPGVYDDVHAIAKAAYGE